MNSKEALEIIETMFPFNKEMIKKDYEYCPKCGCIVGGYIIKEGMGGIGITQEMFCDNYCRVCGEKIDAISFKNKVDKLTKNFLETNKQIED